MLDLQVQRRFMFIAQNFYKYGNKSDHILSRALKRKLGKTTVLYRTSQTCEKLYNLIKTKLHSVLPKISKIITNTHSDIQKHKTTNA